MSLFLNSSIFLVGKILGGQLPPLPPLFLRPCIANSIVIIIHSVLDGPGAVAYMNIPCSVYKESFYKKIQVFTYKGLKRQL